MFRRLLSEPLLHFALLGAAVFVAFHLLNGPLPPAPAEAARIVMDEADLARIVAQYEAVWRRAPTEAELAVLVERQIEQTVLVREARALGLDRDDPVIEGRLQQKMTFLATSLAQSLDPGDAVLAEHLATHGDRFLDPGAVSFAQVFLGTDPDPAEVARLRAALEAGGDPAALGPRSLLPPVARDAAPAAVDGTFGPGTFAAIAALPPGVWSGPLASGYGLHLVRLEAVRAARPLTLAEARDRVLFDWRRDSAERLTAAQLGDLRARYQIVVPDAEALRRALAP
jgi:hypothetical protein